ncbi:MAG: family 16 glycosylhydrolase [candidate division KSB1 bacterium]|nr:family 16 glycosylhydrolase [candidate division KSB1 bacterium]
MGKRVGPVLWITWVLFAWGCSKSSTAPEPSPWKLILDEPFDTLNETRWEKATHTFPYNAARFKPENVTVQDGKLVLTLRPEFYLDRNYTGGELRTRSSYLYGRFSVRMKAARGSGIVSSFFLYRYNPWQEIDIEFLGKDTRKIHLNIYYNPGPEGAANNAGDAGHQWPKVIALPFDAAADFHEYSIEWEEGVVRWYADGKLIHQVADTTHVPDLRMQVMMNLWYSESVAWAGPRDDSNLPAQALYDHVQIFRRR